MEGVGKESIPGAMNMSIIDRVIRVTDTDAFKTCRQLAHKEGPCAVCDCLSLVSLCVYFTNVSAPRLGIALALNPSIYLPQRLTMTPCWLVIISCLTVFAGVLVGGSAGLNVHAAIQVANSVSEPAVIVTVLCDLGIKYLSKVYNDDWLNENNVASPDTMK